jgi:hypothetical protein
MRSVRVTPFPEGAAETWRVRELARPEYLNAFKFCDRLDQGGIGGREGRRTMEWARWRSCESLVSLRSRTLVRLRSRLPERFFPLPLMNAEPTLTFPFSAEKTGAPTRLWVKEVPFLVSSQRRSGEAMFPLDMMSVSTSRNSQHFVRTGSGSPSLRSASSFQLPLHALQHTLPRSLSVSPTSPTIPSPSLILFSSLSNEPVPSSPPTEFDQGASS